jgi:hypothetical protein
MNDEPIQSSPDSVRILLGSCAALVAIAALSLCGSAEAAGQQGMVAVRDPQTGQLRAPSAAELRQLRDQAPAQVKAPPAKGVTMRTDGSGHLTLGDNAMVYSVLTRDAAGKPVVQCVSGHEAAEAALRQPSPAATPDKEHQHEQE